MTRGEPFRVHLQTLKDFGQLANTVCDAREDLPKWRFCHAAAPHTAPRREQGITNVTIVSIIAEKGGHGERGVDTTNQDHMLVTPSEVGGRYVALVAQVPCIQDGNRLPSATSLDVFLIWLVNAVAQTISSCARWLMLKRRLGKPKLR